MRNGCEGRETELVACSWLKEVPWAMIVRQPLGIAHASMCKARRIMVVSVAEAMCGRVEVQSLSGAGTPFTVEFPIQSA